MADAFGTEVERSPDGFWRAGFAGMRGQAQAVVGGPGVGVAEKFWRRFLLVAADADGDDLSVMIANGKLEDFLGAVGSELAHGVEDPDERDAEVARAAG